jgi:two-component system nitrogen regulation sensor histidine kinase NtrY
MRPSSASAGSSWRRVPSDIRSWLLALSTALPAVFSLSLLLSVNALPRSVLIALSLASLIGTAVVAAAIRNGLLHHIRTIGNLLAAVRIQDPSLKGTAAREAGELGALYGQINTLTESLQSDRQNEQELLGILEKVVDRIDVAIIVCDLHDRIRLANLRATALLKTDARQLIGQDVAATALAEVPFASEPRLFDHRFPGGAGRWQISQQQYRHRGQPSRILFITDLKQVLAEQEIAAWQRLIRVLSHEVNNSLTPIMSLCQTLSTFLTRADSAAHATDVCDGLGVIAERAKGLKAFISTYARIARLPEPQKVLFPAAQLVDKVQGMFTAHALKVVGPVPTVRVFGDPVHLEQVLINLIKNAREANEACCAVTLSCRVNGRCLEFEIVDEGMGISNPANLFVPFYTTKSEGAGVGLVLCQQIASRHFGQVMLENRSDARGAVARLVLPLPVQQRAS